jgi:hypothetical protein
LKFLACFLTSSLEKCMVKRVACDVDSRWSVPFATGKPEVDSERYSVCFHFIVLLSILVLVLYYCLIIDVIYCIIIVIVFLYR